MLNEDNFENIKNELKTLNQTQRSINNILKLLVRSEIELRLKHLFKSPEEIIVYQLTNGENTTVEIEKKVSISGTSISRLWQKWEKEYRIVETKGYRQPYWAKYSLEELALLFGKTSIVEINNIEEKE